ncbi:class I SAM-dependent methyltransferase [Aestuariivirga sp. YIM B02566]|uniref:Class I SAM-dependent methyltransferase n=1 Tax=Taklimakanibacter albus TaxID=2800327 RepID=A0ACC5R2L9_9HYPH|nr:class I SAM-dependent methyltransferase [Aestuariivirga sp. YIM B02566]MBK1866915.1 class I SAM-dependent methyltransferase [Aestuariivirga sp. YIM B02566]
MTDRRDHWDHTYTVKSDTAVSWYQDVPERSLALIRKAGTGSVIDIGGGASRLADRLLAETYDDLTVLDISDVALGRSRERLGVEAGKVAWIVADITRWTPERQWDIWHDRAVFHFLTEEAAQDAYIAALKAGTRPGSHIVISTFALSGPEKCSGLPVQRYSAETLAARLGRDFVLETQEVETHATPFGTTQNFTFAVFKRI